MTHAKAQRRKERREGFLLCFRLRLSLRVRAVAWDPNKKFVYNSEAQTLSQLTVTSMLMTTLQHRRANLQRWLGLLLLVFIFYGTTVEAAHRHGNLPSVSNHATSFDAAPESGSSTINAKRGCNDCLICQLHQNFSATLISVKLNTQAVARITHACSSVTVLVSSIGRIPQSGRAPPQAN